MDSAVGQAPESTAEDLRREARRKKILQTAKARLDKLNGLARAAEVNYVDSPATEELDYSDPEVEPSVPIITTFAQQDRIFYSATNVSPNNADVPNKFVTVFLCILIEIFYLKGHQNPQNNILALILPVALLFTGAFVGNKIRQINRLLSILQSLIINLAVNIFCICLSSFLFKLKSTIIMGSAVFLKQIFLLYLITSKRRVKSVYRTASSILRLMRKGIRQHVKS